MEHRKINENVVMQFYLDQLAEDKIIFLQNKPAQKERIEGHIKRLMNETTMNRKIQVAVNLWKELFDASMSYLNPNKSGYDKILSYFDSYVEFEELIFASDSFYRDHTLHCLWVYFLGEYIRRKEEFAQLFESFSGMIKSLDTYGALFEYSGTTDTSQCKDLTNGIACMKKVLEQDEASRCITALCHDLGYPIKKIEKINKSISKVLPAFAISNSRGFNFEYNNIQQEYIKGFIDFISRNFSGSLDWKLEDEDSTLTEDDMLNIFIFKNNSIVGLNMENLQKMDRNEMAKAMHYFEFKALFLPDSGFYLKYFNDFEQYEHGIMSSFLLFKNLDAFTNISFDTVNNELETTDIVRTSRMLTNCYILSAIAAHTNSSYKIAAIDFQSFLTFVDELEEFSRISRASQNREYVEEFCDTTIYMEDEWFNVIFEFNNENLDNLDPEKAFKGRCKRFLSLFAIQGLDPKLKIRLQCVGKLSTNQNTYTLEIARKHADILINGQSVDIPAYLKSNQFYTKEEYARL